MEGERPGATSYLAVLRLLVAAVIDIVILPFRLAVFLFRGKKVKSEIAALVERREQKNENGERSD
jgi:hypothetical protein